MTEPLDLEYTIGEDLDQETRDALTDRDTPWMPVVAYRAQSERLTRERDEREAREWERIALLEIHLRDALAWSALWKRAAKTFYPQAYAAAYKAACDSGITSMTADLASLQLRLANIARIVDQAREAMVASNCERKPVECHVITGWLESIEFQCEGVPMDISATPQEAADV